MEIVVICISQMKQNKAFMPKYENYIGESAFSNTLFQRLLSFLFIFFFFFAAKIIYAQSFELIYKTNFDDISTDAIETPDNSFVLTLSSGNFYEEDYQFKLIKISSEGLLIDSIEIVIPENYALKELYNIYQVNDNLYLTTGLCRNKISDSLKIIIVQFDQNIESNQTFMCNFSLQGNFNIGNNFLNAYGNIVTIGTDFNNYNHFLLEYDMFGNLINYQYYDDENFTARYANAIWEVEQLNKYHLYLAGFPQEFWIIDRITFAIETVKNYNSTFWPWDCSNGINNTNYLVIGRNYLNDNIKKPAFLEVDSSGNILCMQSYNFYADTNSGNINKSFDNYTNKIYIVAAHNFLVTSGYPFIPQQQWIWLMKINTDYSVDWQHFYKGDVNFMPYKVLATTDGGALVLSTRYDWNDPIPDQRDVHILKIDSTGYYDPITGTEEEIEQMNKQILVYPNPTNGDVNFVLGLYSNLQLFVYNSMGKLNLTELLPTSKTIDLSSLPNGVYFYLITGKNGFKESGKILKN
jgi:hypothetical protein